MTFVPFEMERWQSVYEHEVDINLSESGVDPLTLREAAALAGVSLDDLAACHLEYTQSNGTADLRANIATMYPGAGAENVVVTSGSSEANFVAAWNLAAMGGEFVFMEPNYFQIRGIAENLGVPVKIWNLEHPDWNANLERLDELVTTETRAIFICNPSNPTGRAFGREVLEGVASIAQRADAWVLADEVYRGAEHHGDDLTPTLFGVYEKAIAVSGLSKAYGLPGTRVGWAVTEAETAVRLWSRKDYTTIAPTALSDMLATAVLAPASRPAFLARTRAILNRNFALLESWLQARPEEFRWRAPDAGAIALVEFPHAIDTVALADRLRVEESCLIQPGEQFGVPNHVRIGIGPRTEQLEDGLARLGRVLDRVSATAATGTH